MVWIALPGSLGHSVVSYIGCGFGLYLGYFTASRCHGRTRQDGRFNNALSGYDFTGCDRNRSKHAV